MKVAYCLRMEMAFGPMLSTGTHKQARAACCSYFNQMAAFKAAFPGKEGIALGRFNGVPTIAK